MAHKLGGTWTEQKLLCVKSYAEAWASLMANNTQRYGWKTRFIDAFSGTGTYQPNNRGQDTSSGSLFEKSEDEAEFRSVRDGSAKIAMAVEPPFHRIDLIENKRKFSLELERLAADRLNRDVFVHEKDANQALSEVAQTISGEERALAFIDPYGCQVNWSTLEELSRTEKVDVWYLFPTMGVNRQLRSDPQEISEATKDRLCAILGTSSWEREFYESDLTPDLLGEVDHTTRKAGPSNIERFFLERLKLIFPYVHEDCLRLHNSRNGHLFSLTFAISSESEKAKRHAKRLANDAISKVTRGGV